MGALARFEVMAATSEDRLDLGEAALLIGAAAQPGVDVKASLRGLDTFARDVHDLDDLVARLFHELGFRGNAGDYYDPDNSFLHRVIERRVGIPITLAVVMMEVGRRAGVELEGVGMPGHFLVRDPHVGVYIDPFAGGTTLDEAACEAIFRASTGAGPEIQFGSDLLARATKHDILARILANLKAIYRSRGSFSELELVLRMRLSLPRAGVAEVIELGETIALQGDFGRAATEMERRAETDVGDSEAVVAAARGLRARLN